MPKTPKIDVAALTSRMSRRGGGPRDALGAAVAAVGAKTHGDIGVRVWKAANSDEGKK